MTIYGITDKGKIRPDNQDSFFTLDLEQKNCHVLVLCDGMGGANAGGLASEVACKAFLEIVRAGLTSRTVKTPNVPQIFTKAVTYANETVCEYAQISDEYSGMGTTLVAAWVEEHRGSVCVTNVGDSRAYLLSRRFGITQITKDHSYVQQLVSSGIITPAQARTHPKKNIITRALGASHGVQGDIYNLFLDRGDVLLLCSDGLSNFVTDADIYSAFLSQKDPEPLCRELLRMTLEAGAPDNVTILAAKR